MACAPLWTGALLLFVGACGSSTPGSQPGSGSTGSGGANSGTAGTAGGSGIGTGGGGGGGPVNCTQPTASVVPLSVLSESQYNNSVLDIVQVAGNPADGLGENFDDVSLEQRANVAATVASQAAASLAKWAPCMPAAGAPATCEQQIIDKIGARLYRRPLSDVERGDMTKLFDAGIKEKDFTTGVEWFLTGLMQSPYFVYQVVRPDAAEKPGEVRPLTGPEYASRLAYFIWDGPPDDALITAATNNELSDAAKRDAQVSRLMKDARFSRGVAQFYTRWLKLSAFREVARDVADFDQSVVTSLSASLLMSATELYKSDSPNISSLFSGDSYYLNDVLGKFYGVSGTGSTFQAVSMAGQSRRGILTHPALMASLSRSDESFPIGRGLFVLRNVVCKVVPALPPNFVPPQQPPFQEGVSTRKRLEAHTASPMCQACHSMINPSGFIFESFDEVGRYRMTDHGAPVDTSVTLNIGMDVDGTYASGDELVAKFGESQAVRACFAEKYLDFAVAHAVTDPADTCSIEAIGKSFAATGDLKQLVVSVAGSDSFRLRLAEGVGQ